MSELTNHVGVKKQMIMLSVNSYVSNYQTKVFFSGSNIHNLRNKIITSMQLFTNSEISKLDNNAVVDLTNNDFSTFITLVGKNGNVILNLLPAAFLYEYNYQEQTESVLREFLMVIDWEKSYLLLVWNASPTPGSVIAFMIGYVDSPAQLPEHVLQAIN